MRTYLVHPGGTTIDTSWKVIYNDANKLFDSNPNYAVVNFDLDVDNNVIKALLDDKFVPAKGSEIYVAPGCPYASDDIRKNYTLKRKYDTGCCNVFSKLRTSSIPCYVAIIKDRKELAFFDYYNHRDGSECVTCIRNISGYENLRPSEIEVKYKRICYTVLSDSWINFLEGKLTKPAISYKKLDMNFGLEMTDDVVELVYQAGRQRGNSQRNGTNEEKLALELSAMAQYNWRDYPRTLYCLKGLLNFLRYNAYSCLTHRKSQASKSIRPILDFNPKSTAASQADFDMAKRLMLKALGLQDGVKFVNYDDIQKRMNNYGVPLWLFHEVFNTVVRIKPKEYEATDNTVQKEQS